MASHSRDQSPTERSSLLPKPIPNDTHARVPIPNTGVEATGPEADGFANDSENGEASLERHDSALGRQQQYEGIPEVRERMIYIAPALAIGVFLASADQTIITASYGKMGSELGALNKTSWIATAYFLTLTSFQPLYGKMSDIFSRKSCLLFAYVVFGLGCLGCGLAKTIDQLIVARAIAGMGGGGMTTVVSIILSDAIPLRDRGQWQGYLNIMWASGAGTGAPVGGLLADSIGWRWSFLIQAPMCLVGAVTVALVLQLPSKEQTDWKAKLKRIDFFGAITLVSAVFALLLGLDRGSNVSWRAIECLVPLCLFVPLATLFLFIEWKVATEPFAPKRILAQRSLLAGNFCNYFAAAGWMGAVYTIPLYFQAARGFTALKTGLFQLPPIVAGVSGSLLAGFVMRRTGKYYWLNFAAYSNIVTGLVLILLFSGLAVTSDVCMIIGMTICGFSSGISVTSSLVALISNASRNDQAIGTACLYLFRSLGSTTGVALTSSIGNQTLRSYLQEHLSSGKDAQKIVEGVRKSLGFIKTLSPELQALVRKGYEISTRSSFTFEMVIAIGAAVSALFILEKPLSDKK